MSTILYSNKIRDAQSKSVDPDEDFFVCKEINDKWHIIQSDHSAYAANKSKDILAEHDLINGHITDINCYRLFKRGLNEIRNTL
jgi:hypothetical protein